MLLGDGNSRYIGDSRPIVPGAAVIYIVWMDYLQRRRPFLLKVSSTPQSSQVVICFYLQLYAFV